MESIHGKADFDFSKFVQWSFYSMITACAISAVTILARLNGSIESLNMSVSDLNQKVAVVVVNISWHEKEIGLLRERVDKLERR